VIVLYTTTTTTTMAPSFEQRDESRRKETSLTSSVLMSSEPSHYDVLRVPATATAAAIKQAYHAAARQHHPDSKKRGFGCEDDDDSDHKDHDADDDDNDDDDARFRRVHAAWECLRDPETRRLYNQERSVQQAVRSSRRRNAVPICANECRREPITEQQDDDVDDDCYELVYQCRCGSDLHTSQLPALQDGTDNNDESSILIQCPGCSLVYDISSLYDDEGDDDEEPS
jgi:curved DNA-binding protein CbpA